MTVFGLNFRFGINIARIFPDVLPTTRVGTAMKYWLKGRTPCTNFLSSA